MTKVMTATSTAATSLLATIAALVCAWCKRPGLELRRPVEQLRSLIEGATPKLGCDACLSIVERGMAARIPAGPAPLAANAVCPPWCDHERAHAHPIDITHESDWRDLAENGTGDVSARIHQQPGKAPRIMLAICSELGDAEMDLTPEEAIQAAYGLINKAMAARAATSN